MPRVPMIAKQSNNMQINECILDQKFCVLFCLNNDYLGLILGKKHSRNRVHHISCHTNLSLLSRNRKSFLVSMLYKDARFTVYNQIYLNHQVLLIPFNSITNNFLLMLYLTSDLLLKLYLISDLLLIYPWPSGLRAWDSLFTMKNDVREVVGSIPNQGNILGEFFILPGYLVRFSL